MGTKDVLEEKLSDALTSIKSYKETQDPEYLLRACSLLESVLFLLDGRYYFAYGSNLLREQMDFRCPKSKPIASGYIDGFRFVYDGSYGVRNGAVANIIPDKCCRVWGAVYRLTVGDEKRLDIFEECYPPFYDKISVEVVLNNGGKIKAFTYIKKPEPVGLPSLDYQEIVVKGAREWELPESYIQEYLIKR
jgi:gamma-glutamylcyclotransferase (GGCT)/AIG2-like uncharacterized protein YtfP